MEEITEAQETGINGASLSRFGLPHPWPTPSKAPYTAGKTARGPLLLNIDIHYEKCVASSCRAKLEMRCSLRWEDLNFCNISTEEINLV